MSLAASGARAQIPGSIAAGSDLPPGVDSNGWGPPAAPKTSVQKQEAAAAAKPSYVNPGTGVLAPVPPPPPLVTTNEFTPPPMQQTVKPMEQAPKKGVFSPGSSNTPAGIIQEKTPDPFSSLKPSYLNPSTGATVSVPPPPPLVPTNEWTPATFQQPAKPMDKRVPGEEDQEVKIQLEPPGPDRIFGRRDSERSLQERMRQEWRQQKRTPYEFPDEPVLSTQAYAGRVFPPMTETVEPNYLCYGRLYFEDKNSERYGWDLGFIQPVVSAGIFFWDTATLPYRVGTEPCRRYECNSGYCMPGDPVPYLLYPPIWSVTGAAAEIGAVVALAAIFPM